MTMGIGQSGFPLSGEEIHTPSTSPLYVVWFFLDTTGRQLHNPASLLLRPRGEKICRHRPLGGKRHAIFAGMDCAVY